MILAVVQARMLSSRLPGKVMKHVLGKPMIGILFERLSRSKKIDKIILSTSAHASNDEMDVFISGLGFGVFRGSEEDVLDRFYQSARPHKPKTIVRITGDCPLIDYKIVDKTIELYETGSFDYVSNATNPPVYPDGMDVEVFSFKALETAWKEAKLPSEREHVTAYIKKCGKFRLGDLFADQDYQNDRWTVDHEEDFELFRAIVEALHRPGQYFDMKDILDFKAKHPELFENYKKFLRNEGYLKSLEHDKVFGVKS